MAEEKEIMTEKIIIVSGYFDPIHAGHVECLKLAKELGGKLIVILNNDKQAVLKKGKAFMPQDERKKILEAIKFVDEVFDCIDEEELTDENGRRHIPVIKSIRKIAENYPDYEIIFAKGGDRFSHEIPEAKACLELGIKIVDGLGEKIQSSSNLTGIKEIK
jgi:D-beta-D-heptose 7-phosphate kinase/D-beta-D-heptose 1-phosphate adenosyltransferase